MPLMPLRLWLEIIKKLAKGVSPDVLSQEYNVAKTTVYKLKEKGEKLKPYAQMISLLVKGVTEEDAREWLEEDGYDVGHLFQPDQEIAATSPGIVVPSAGADVTAAGADVEDLDAIDAEPIPNLSVICNAADILLTYLDHKDCPAVFRPQLYDELQLMREKLDRFLKCPPAPTTSTPLPNLTLADDPDEPLPTSPQPGFSGYFQTRSRFSDEESDLKCPPAPTTSTPLPNLTLADDPDEPLPTSPQPGFSGYFQTRSRFSDEESDIFSPKKLPRLKAPHFPSSDEESDLFSPKKLPKLPRLKLPHFPSSDEESDLFSSEKLPRLKAPHFSSSDETE